MTVPRLFAAREGKRARIKKQTLSFFDELDSSAIAINFSISDENTRSESESQRCEGLQLEVGSRQSAQCAKRRELPRLPVPILRSSDIARLRPANPQRLGQSISSN